MQRTANGNGCIVKRKDGRFQGSIQIEGVRKTFYGHSEKEVRQKLKYHQAQVLMGVKEGNRIDYDSYFSYWLENVKKIELKPSSYDRLERTYNSYIKNILGKEIVQDITSKELQSIIVKYTQNYSYSTVKKIYEALNASLSYAVSVRDLVHNPMDAVVKPRESVCGKTTKDIIIPTDCEMEKFFSEAGRQFGNGTYVYNQNYVDIYSFICKTGLRIGEVLALTIDKIDFERGEIRIDSNVSEVVDRDKESGRHYKRIITEPKTKNGKRTLVLGDEAIEILKRIQKRNTESLYKGNLLLINKKGTSPSIHDMENALKRICRKAGIKPLGLHTLRHYFASKFLGHGGDAFVLSKYLGHGNPSITLRIYAHLTEEHNQGLKEIINRL